MHTISLSSGLAVRARFDRARCFAAAVSLLGSAPLRAQQLTRTTPPARASRIVGRILDATTGQGLSEVRVQIVGTTLGTSSAIEGRYSVRDIPAGTVTIQVRRLGYAPETVTGILLDAGQTLEQNITMQPATVQLQAMQVTAASERGWLR